MENANTMVQQGRLDEGEQLYRDILFFHQFYPGAIFNLGVIAQLKGQLDKAMQYMELAIRLDPDSKSYYFGLGELYHTCAADDDAHALLTSAQKRFPGDADVDFKLACLLDNTHQLDQALELYHRVVTRKPGHLSALINMGVLFIKKRQPETAIVFYKRALEIDPDSYAVNFNIGLSLREMGMGKDAISYFEKALAAKPGDINALKYIVSCQRFESPDHFLIYEFLAMLSNPKTEATTRVEIYFALGKIHDDLALYDRSFTYYQKANQAKRALLNWQPQAHSAFIDQIISNYVELYKNANPLKGSDSEAETFIIGMPRSGTSLVEIILSSHPMVQACGEMSTISQLTQRIRTELKTDIPYPDCILHADRKTIEILADVYQQTLRADTDQSARVITDKMPYNFLHLGLISLLFPNARILHCVRHPLDTCLSVYFQNFERGNLYAYDLKEIGHYYVEYRRLMDCWCNLLKLRTMVVVYERLIQQTESTIRKMLQFLRLPWDEACLSFYKNKAPVQTLSAIQTRRPIYTSSLNRYEQYINHMADLKELFSMHGYL